MQVKTFTGPNVQAVLAQVKADMGTEAIILSSRDVRKEGQLWHEVTAGVDSVPENSSPEWSEWHKEWDKIKEHLYALMQPSLQWERLSPRQRVALEYLQREGTDDAVIVELYHKLASAPGASVLEALSEIVPTRPWTLEAWPERLHIMAGPCGSGKTTAALRMALLLRQEDPTLKVAFINGDCERGNGRLLLRHWAELSDFAYLEASDNEAMRTALRTSADADCVFVDLPGLSASSAGAGKDATLMETLTALGLQGLGGAVHLALPPHYGTAQNRAFLTRYQSGMLASIVWTKLDEAACYGPLINVASTSGLPVSALSYGSAMRGSLVPAQEAALWRLVFKRQLPSQGAAESEGEAQGGQAGQGGRSSAPSVEPPLVARSSFSDENNEV
ncbi:MAG: flagellar biosynthesis protein FlhF [Bilophila sp.]